MRLNQGLQYLFHKRALNIGGGAINLPAGRSYINTFVKNPGMEAPKLPSFFKQNQHKRFDYSPRFYDERKERIEEMRKKYGGTESSEKFSGDNFRLRMNSEWRNSGSRKKSSGANMRLVVIVLVLFLISYLILFN